MIVDHYCTQILNSVPLEMEDRKSDFSGMDFTVLRFTVENSVESEEKFHAFHKSDKPLKMASRVDYIIEVWIKLSNF